VNITSYEKLFYGSQLNPNTVRGTRIQVSLSAEVTKTLVIRDSVTVPECVCVCVCVCTDWRSVLEQMNLHFCFSLLRNEWYGTPCRVLSARPFSSTCYNSNKKRHTISESPLNLEYVSSAQRPSQYQAEMRYVNATFSDVRSKSVNKVWQLQCTRHLDFRPAYKTVKITIR